MSTTHKNNGNKSTEPKEKHNDKATVKKNLDKALSKRRNPKQKPDLEDNE